MDNTHREEKLIKNLMKHSLTKMPFDDFEARMMDKIHQEKRQHKSVLNNIRFAWIFFFVGLFLGLAITNMTANLSVQLYGISLKQITLIIQIGIALVLLFQFEKLLDLSFRKKN
jgi:TRAP-type C4-dicarboxylate transport system permease small subunit